MQIIYGKPTTGGKWVVENKPFQGHFAGVEHFQVPFSSSGSNVTCTVSAKK
jgi:ribosomal protein S27E